MGDSIRLHKEHGLNPSVTSCKICGHEYGVALLGAACKEQAPMHITHGYCTECQNALDQGGVFFIETRDGETGDNPYRTGYLVAVTLEAAKNVFGNVDFDHQRIFFVEQSVMKTVMGDLYEGGPSVSVVATKVDYDKKKSHFLLM